VYKKFQINKKSVGGKFALQENCMDWWQKDKKTV
jgi:hypothetical protein